LTGENGLCPRFGARLGGRARASRCNGKEREKQQDRQPAEQPAVTLHTVRQRSMAAASILSCCYVPSGGYSIGRSACSSSHRGGTPGPVQSPPLDPLPVCRATRVPQSLQMPQRSRLRLLAAAPHEGLHTVGDGTKDLSPATPLATIAYRNLLPFGSHATPR